RNAIVGTCTKTTISQGRPRRRRVALTCLILTCDLSRCTRRSRGSRLADGGLRDREGSTSMRKMNSTQATAEQPARGRIAGLLEENGLLVIVLGAFAIVFVLSL